jgi:hypothetical protein
MEGQECQMDWLKRGIMGAMQQIAITFLLLTSMCLDQDWTTRQALIPNKEIKVQFIALPWIEEDDYPAFQALIVGLPASYEGWLDRQRAAAAFLQESGGAPQITVTPDQLRLHLLACEPQAREKELWILATLLAGIPSFF